MTDNEIIELYFARSENAITETDSKYGAYCRAISYNILGSSEDSEECVSDTYMNLWNAIPPARPRKLSVYIASVVRSVALNMRRRSRTIKRGSGNIEAVYDELAECVSADVNVEDEAVGAELVGTINAFLGGLSAEKRRMFMLRYFCFRTVEQISDEMGVSVSKVKVTLHRTRAKLREQLKKEGYDV